MQTAIYYDDLYNFDVQTSLFTPQRGKYHNEGNIMMSHLNEMGACLNDKTYVPHLSKEVLEKVSKYDWSRETIQTYIMLHDIMKPHCMTFVYDDGTKKPVTWSEWMDMYNEVGELYDIESKYWFDEALDHFGVESISYFQAGKPFRAHGPLAANLIEECGGVSPMIVEAIRNHEKAFGFLDENGKTKINLKSFRKNFGYLSDEGVVFCLLTSLLDQMASVRKDSSIDVTAYKALEANYLAWLEQE